MKLFSKNENKRADEPKGAVDAAQTNEQVVQPANDDNSKARVYNLIILDKSGSMNSIANAAVDGFNETLGGALSAQRQYADTQTHYVSLLLFCGLSIEYVYDCVPIKNARELSKRDYCPCGNTPLYDAMGLGINDLFKRVKDDENAAVIVTVITDGMENSSSEYSGSAIKALVDKMRDEYGWNFSYIGANHDVEAAAKTLSIENTMSFDYSSEGMTGAWDKERKSRYMMYDEIDYCMGNRPSWARQSAVEKIREMLRGKKYREWNDSYERRVTPDFVRDLREGQVFVFGTNERGDHTGVAAQTAVERFGAIRGQASGMQGNSYAIPTTGTMRNTGICVNQFIDYASSHPDQTFLVTMVGCGGAGHSVPDMAHLFSRAVDIENIWLPRQFWNELI